MPPPQCLATLVANEAMMRNLGFSTVGWACLALVLGACGEAADKVDAGFKVGKNDSASMAACTAFATSADAPISAQGESEAGQAILEADKVYEIDTSEGAYVTLNVTKGHGDWALFVSSGTDISSSDLSFGAPDPPGACSDKDYWDLRAHVHHKGQFVLKLEGNTKLRFYAQRLDSDHSSHGDVGMHHDHDGGHMGLEDSGHKGHGDAGMHHEDGGRHHQDAGHHHTPDAGGHHHQDGGHHHHGDAN